LFNDLEVLKFDTNNKIIALQDEFNQIENEADKKISEWICKYNVKEED
jgi:hypothetical protein